MEPTLPRGATVRIAALEPAALLEVGDVVVIAAAAGEELIVHRVLHAFVESGRDFIIHQGDAPGTSFAVASREQVLARAIAVDDESSNSPRPIGHGDLYRFAARRLVSRGYLVARLFVERIGVSPPPALRRASARLRSIAARAIELPPLQVRLTLSLNLPAARGGGVSPGVAIREISPAEIEPLLAGHPDLAKTLPDLEQLAPHGWRCFVATIDGRPAHVSFVETRPGRPLLFGAVTEPAGRGRGLFRATVHFIAGVLEREGASALWSSLAGENRRSIRAYRAAGFTVVPRSLDVYVGKTSVRALARRIVFGK